MSDVYIIIKLIKNIIILSIIMFFTYHDKESLKKQIENLNNLESIYVYNILKKNDEKTTINVNGLFFDLLDISNKSLEEIVLFLNKK